MISKSEIREKIWKLMDTRKISRPPRPIYGRIPNFIGAEEAASRLKSITEWRKASIIKVNPDSPQKWVRLLALRDRKKIIFATPRLREGFLLLDPVRIPGYDIEKASTIRGAFIYGRKIWLDEVKDLNIDIMVTGSVAVDRYGHRIGKGEGYAELEYAILRELNAIDAKTPILTTIHDIQLVDYIPRDPYDLLVDVIATPTRLIRIETSPLDKPKGIYWDLLPCSKLTEIPILIDLAKRKGKSNLVSKCLKISS